MNRIVLVSLTAVSITLLSNTAWSARTLDITTPNGGEELVKSKKYMIEWNNKGYGKNRKVKIELLKQGKKYRIIDAKTKNDGKFEWKVPDDVPFSKKIYQIRVVSVKPNGKRNGIAADKSDKKFTIVKK